MGTIQFPVAFSLANTQNTYILKCMPLKLPSGLMSRCSCMQSAFFDRPLKTVSHGCGDIDSMNVAYCILCSAEYIDFGNLERENIL